MSGRVILMSLVVLLTCHFVCCDTTPGFRASAKKVEDNIDINGVNQLYNLERNETEKSSSENGQNSNVDFDEYYTFYDKIFWLFLSSFIVYIMYVRAVTNFRIDYPDEIWSPFISTLIKYRKIVAPDPYLDAEMMELHQMTAFRNGPLIAFWILVYCVSLFSLDEVFGVTNKHIEDLRELIVALFIYFINILGVCIVFDLCVSAPMKYYKE